MGFLEVFIAAQSCDSLARLDERLRASATPDDNLFSEVLTLASSTRSTRDRGGARIAQLIANSAWTDAALALIAFGLPNWKLRHLAHENGEWFCSLTSHPCLPVEIDDTADACHETLPLAILRAFVEARRRDGPMRRTITSVPNVKESSSTLCCDNFA